MSLVGIAYALIVIPLIVSNINKQQELRGRAQVVTPAQESELTDLATNQSSLSLCTSQGNAEIGVSYTNTDKKRSITVTATDEVSGKSVSLGTIEAQETKTATLASGKSAISTGTIRFAITYTDTNQKEEKTSTYQTKSCTPFNKDLTAQSLQTNAAVPATCGNVTTDIMLIIDRSSSMGQGNKLVAAKNAAKNFIDVVSSQESTTRVGMVAFSTTSTIPNKLTTNYASVKTSVDALTASGYTCQECGITEANKEIAANGRPGVKKVVVMLTDGEANYVIGGNATVPAATGESKALAAVKSGFTADKTVFFTIGLGDANSTGDAKFYSADYMNQVATLTGGKFYFPAPSELDSVYQEISQLLGKGLLGGFVFNDTNMNGNFDSSEQKLSGWTIQASSSAGVKTATTDSKGEYTIKGLCDGNYKLSQVAKSGWTQTLPANGAPYSVDITNASQYNDKLFGNTDKSRCSDNIDNDNNGFKDSADSSCHTDGNPKNASSYDPKKDGEHEGANTCGDSKDNNGDGRIDGADPICHTDGNPNNPATYDPKRQEVPTSINMTVFLDGIGNRGDNSNPTNSSLSNKNPKHPTIGADIQVFTLSNQLIASGTGTVTYNTTTGNYIGDIPIQNGFPTGQYTMKVKADKHLRRLVDGVQNITAGKKNDISSAALVAGDINNDNKLNILDYNLLLDCYSDLKPAVNCVLSTKKVNSDINDDGAVNQIDYNLFLREIATQPGQ